MNFFSKNCLKEIISLERALQVEKQHLASCEDYTPQACHRLFSSSAIKRFGPNEVLDLISSFGVACTIHQARLILQRYDGDEDGKLGFWEFANIYQPHDL